jgi:SAM-dependent methyltransferase
VTQTKASGGELREGSVSCSVCGETRSISAGIVDLFPPDLPEFVKSEAAGLDRFADSMRADGWTRETILELPERYDGYWDAQATAMRQALSTRKPKLAAGRSILDVGSNTCWASAILAERGLDVTALDINAGEMQGLRTADWWFDAKGIYFERVLGVMFALPFADETFDFVWCCGVLHHNGRANLYRTMRELRRVLKPGGSVFVVNEPCRSLRTPKIRPGREVAQYEGNEHVYQPRTYIRAARRAGLDVQLVYPWTVGMFTPHVFKVPRTMGIRRAAWIFVVHVVRHIPLLSRAALAYKQYVDGRAAFHMIASRPVQAP